MLHVCHVCGGVFPPVLIKIVRQYNLVTERQKRGVEVRTIFKCTRSPLREVVMMDRCMPLGALRACLWKAGCSKAPGLSAESCWCRMGRSQKSPAGAPHRACPPERTHARQLRTAVPLDLENFK